MQPVDPDSQIGSDGEKIVEARLTLDAVRRAFAALPDEQRTVLLLVCVEGYSYREIAEITGMPMGTVISRVARGRMALSRMVEGGTRLGGGVAETR
jgi:RNA polymerase sigma-70 factor (ECF subfamily)